MKRLIAFITAVAAALCIFAAVPPISVSADALYVKKVVSVVYDDSGSMISDTIANWAYASYAMQAFAGMLNSDDELYITYMNDTSWNFWSPTESVDLSNDRIQDSIDDIRNHFNSGGTPFSAVDDAMDVLRNVKNTDENTQYWLVVITDGAFGDAANRLVPKSDLDEAFQNFVSEEMANGTAAQVTYLAIGDGAIVPTEDIERGIYVEESAGADDIINVMAKIADQISGRSRLDSSEITQLDSKSIKVTSDIPLLNIAVLSQKSTAKVVSAVYNGEQAADLEIKRSVSFRYPDNPKDLFYANAANDHSLVGGGFLIGNSGNTINAGTYTLTFDTDVTLDDFVVMFEPALEVRMTIMLNGKEISDLSELEDAQEKDRISVSYKIYEVGTNNEVSRDLLPKGTNCEITISEDGNIKKTAKDENMGIDDYELGQKLTKINAQVEIDGFNPIRYTIVLRPKEYVPRVTYTLSAEFADGIRGVQYDKLSTNTDMRIEFTVYADGKPIGSAAEVNALNPQISVSPAGNGGSVTVSDEGKIVYTPQSAPMVSANDEDFDVTVTCSVAGVSASETYTVLMHEYEVIPMPVTDSVVKTRFFGNTVGVSFYITKDGDRLGKSEVEGSYAVSLNKAHAYLTVNTTISSDGTITCVPVDPDEYKLHFGHWLFNWWHYLVTLPGEYVNVTLEHPFGTASGTIDVVGEDLKYILCNVVAPCALWHLFVLLVVHWLYFLWKRPKFPKKAKLYYGNIEFNHNSSIGSHNILSWQRTSLKKYNTIKYLYGMYWRRSPFLWLWRCIWPTMKPAKFNVNGVILSPNRGSGVTCGNQKPWYYGLVQPYKWVDSSFIDDGVIDFGNPGTTHTAIREYRNRHNNAILEIEEISTDNKIEIGQSCAVNSSSYYVVGRNGVEVTNENNTGKYRIKSGILFRYVVEN